MWCWFTEREFCGDWDEIVTMIALSACSDLSLAELIHPIVCLGLGERGNEEKVLTIEWSLVGFGPYDRNDSYPLPVSATAVATSEA